MLPNCQTQNRAERRSDVARAPSQNGRVLKTLGRREADVRAGIPKNGRPSGVHRSAKAQGEPAGPSARTPYSDAPLLQPALASAKKQPPDPVIRRTSGDVGRPRKRPAALRPTVV